VDAGSWDGAGLRNSGLFLSFPPQLLAYKMTFSKAGSYPYVCTIHPEMKGTIKVG
jgi:Plastocyanin